jgi:hypothetical protein
MRNGADAVVVRNAAAPGTAKIDGTETLLSDWIAAGALRALGARHSTKLRNGFPSARMRWYDDPELGLDDPLALSLDEKLRSLVSYLPPAPANDDCTSFHAPDLAAISLVGPDGWIEQCLIVHLVRIEDLCARLDPELLTWLLDEPVENFAVSNRGTISSIRSQDRALMRLNGSYAMSFDRRTTRNSFARGRDVVAALAHEIEHLAHEIGEEIRLETRDLLLLRPDRLLLGFSRARSYLGLQGTTFHHFKPGGPEIRLLMASTHGQLG